MAFGFGPLPPLRRSVIDPDTGRPVITSAPTGAIQQRTQVLPIGRDDSGSLVPAFPKAMFDAVDAARFPGQVLRGEKGVFDPTTGHVSDEAMGAAAGIAGTAMTGSLPFGAPKGALRMFGGWNAETADHAALSKAQNLKATGADRQAIWDQTGWFEGPDKHWRFEIPDDLATLGTPKNAPPGYSRLYHDDLGDAYPELWGSTQQSIRESPVMAGRYEAQDGVIHAQGPTAADQRSVALHELQHAIQSQEGFARGANPRSFTATEWEAAGLPMLSESKNAAQAQERWARDQYHRTAGEVEARNVQTRRDFTPEQRRVIPPWETQDVPDAQQIVRPSGTALFSGGRGGVAPAAAAMVRPEVPSNTQDSPMSANLTSGLPANMSLADIARLFGQATMGAPQSFTGTSGTVIPQNAEAPPLSFGPLPPSRPADLTTPQADMPAPNAVPTQGQMPAFGFGALPGTSAPAPAPAPAAAPTAAPAEGGGFGDALGRFRDRGGFDLLGNIGMGLLSAPRWGEGLAVGLQANQRQEATKAATDLARAEYGLKAGKLARETKGENATRAYLLGKGMDPNLADAAMSNPSILSNVMGQLNKDPSVVQIGGQKYSLRPGEKPSEANLLGPADAEKDKATLVDVPQPDGTTQKMWIKPGETAGQPVGAPERSGNSNVAVVTEERRKVADSLGWKPDSDQYKSFVATGKLPKEDQQTLTVTDKNAILEADEAVAANKSTIGQLRSAIELSKKAYSGPGASYRGYATSLFGNEAGIATENLTNTVTGQALENLKATFGGAPTEGERKILLDVQGAASQAPEVREEIYRRAIAAAERRQKFNEERAAQLRGGTYYKTDRGGAAPAPSALAVPAVAPGNAPARPQSKADYDALPPNTPYIAPDGSLRTKP